MNYIALGHRTHDQDYGLTTMEIGPMSLRALVKKAAECCATAGVALRLYNVDGEFPTRVVRSWTQMPRMRVVCEVSLHKPTRTVRVGWHFATEDERVVVSLAIPECGYKLEEQMAAAVVSAESLKHKV